MPVSKVSREEWTLGGIGVFLIIDLLLLPWFDFGSIGPVSLTLTATDAPDGWLGVLAVLGAIAFVADLGLEKFANADVPAIGGSRERTRLLLAGFTAGCIGLKFLFHISHVGDLGFGGWLALIAGGALVALAARPGTIG